MVHSCALILATIATYAISIAIAAVLHPPIGHVPWGAGIYIAIASLILVGYPTRGLLRHLHLTSVLAFAGGGACASLLSAMSGVLFQWLFLAQDKAQSISWFRDDPIFASVAVLSYVACGSLTAVIYWSMARPDKNTSLSSGKEI